MPRPSLHEAIAGFYAVLDRDDEALAHALLEAGAKVLQVRLKPLGRRVGAAELLRVARMARRVCDEHDAAMIVNDRLDVAALADADGVHLGQTDLSLAAAKTAMTNIYDLEWARGHPHPMWIGVSTHDLAQVTAAVAGGADYLGYGPVYGTTTKRNPDATQGLAALRAAVITAGTTPVVAIGGVTPAHASELFATGVAAVCAISSVNGAADVRAAGRALKRVFRFTQ